VRGECGRVGTIGSNIDGKTLMYTICYVEAFFYVKSSQGLMKRI